MDGWMDVPSLSSLRSKCGALAGRFHKSFTLWLGNANASAGALMVVQKEIGGCSRDRERDESGGEGERGEAGGGEGPSPRCCDVGSGFCFQLRPRVGVLRYCNCSPAVPRDNLCLRVLPIDV